MNKFENEKQQLAIRKWIDISKWNNPCSIDLTMKKSIKYYNNNGSMRKKISKYEAYNNFRHFLNILNKKIFGNASIRYGKSLVVFAVLEGTKNKHLHYHAIIDVPLGKDIKDFKKMLRETWLETDWGDEQMKINFNINQGKLNYITKLKDKYSVADSIDWLNVTLDS